jgi:alpha-glucosidase (family GH31 glycosyl hydrolase)
MLYALENARGIYEGQRSVDSNKRVFILTRSAYGGMQRYARLPGVVMWVPGGLTLRNQVSGGLNFSMSGLPYWTMDIWWFCSGKHDLKIPMKQTKLSGGTDDTLVPVWCICSYIQGTWPVPIPRDIQYRTR